MDGSRVTAYIAQILAGCSATGAIFADGQVTQLRVALAAVAALASLAALLVTMKSAREQQLLERKVHLLTEGGDLPYSLEQEVSKQIDEIAVGLNLTPHSLERFKDLNCYFYRNAKGETLLFALRSEDLRRLWLEPTATTSKTIRDWMENGPSKDELRDIARLTVFSAVSSATVDQRTNNIDPMRISGETNPNGSVRYSFQFPQSGRPDYVIAVNVADWKRDKFSTCIAMANLFERVRSEVAAPGSTH